MGPANLLQRRWCESLLARAPEHLHILRAIVASSYVWLEQHPARVLFPSHRERLLRYERQLDAHAVPMPGARVQATKTQQRRKTIQLALSLESRKADR